MVFEYENFDMYGLIDKQMTFTQNCYAKSEISLDSVSLFVDGFIVGFPKEIGKIRKKELYQLIIMLPDNKKSSVKFGCT